MQRSTADPLSGSGPGPKEGLVRRHNLGFVLGHLPPAPCRVLEVGCGDGELAADLADLGYEVTAVDQDPRQVAAARRRGVDALEGDFLSFEGGPFDAVLFPRSLHHLAPLEGAVDLAFDLLAEGGTLIADEFDFAAMDEATAAWFYGLRSVLAACSAVAAAGELHGGPLHHWLHAHHHDPPLSSGAQMLEVLGRRLTLLRQARTPYLYRYFHFWMEEDPRREGVVKAAHSTEEALLGRASIQALGLQVVARKALL